MPAAERVTHWSPGEPEYLCLKLLCLESLSYCTTTVSILTTRFDQFIAWPKFDQSHYAELKEKALTDATSNESLSMTDYLRFEKDGAYILAYYLESGAAAIRDKKTSQFVGVIEIEHSTDGGPWSSCSGRRFYIGKMLILETVDMIS